MSLEVGNDLDGLVTTVVDSALYLLVSLLGVLLVLFAVDDLEAVVVVGLVFSGYDRSVWHLLSFGGRDDDEYLERETTVSTLGQGKPGRESEDVLGLQKKGNENCNNTVDTIKNEFRSISSGGTSVT